MKQGKTYAGRRGDGFIEERKTKGGVVRFVARWPDGKRYASKTFDTVDDAEAHLATVRRDRRSGRYTPDSELTVAELLDDYLRRGADRWSSNTVGLYRSSVSKIIVPRIGRTRIRDLTPRMAQTFLDDLYKAYGPPTVARARTILSGAFSEAEQLDVVPRNPMRGLRGRPERRKDREVWSREEVNRVLDHVADDAMLSAWYHLALTTGMRPGELRGLRWADLDFTRGVVIVRHTATRDAEKRTVISTTTKTGKTRMVRLPSPTIAALQRWRPVLTAKRLRAEHWHDDDLVFPRRDGWPSPQPSWDRRHRRVCVEAGVRIIPPHGTRHTAATLMIEAGVDVKTVSSILGHSSVSLTMDVYVKVTDAMQRVAADTFEEMLRRSE